MQEMNSGNNVRALIFSDTMLGYWCDV